MDRMIYGANWYCRETNQFHRIDETTLPVLDREMISMIMGGGYFGFELPAEIKALSAEMSVNGVHEDLKSRFGREPGDWTELRYYERLINVFPTNASGQDQPSGPAKSTGRIVFLKGLLNTYTQGGVKGLKASAATRLRFSSIVYYHDMIGGKTIHKFDVQNNTLIIDGVNYSAEHNRLLAI